MGCRNKNHQVQYLFYPPFYIFTLDMCSEKVFLGGALASLWKVTKKWKYALVPGFACLWLSPLHSSFLGRYGWAT